jgi:hypothetical protein
MHLIRKLALSVATAWTLSLLAPLPPVYADDEDNRIEDLTLAIAPGSPEKIYSTATAYEARSVRYAYVNTKIIEAFVNANARGSIPEDKMSAILGKARREATDHVNGVSYRGGWVEAISKDTVSTLTGLSKKLSVVDISNTSDKAVEAFLDYVAKPGQSPDMTLNAQIVANSFSLRHMRNKGPLPRELVQSATDFFPEVNPKRDLELNGTVVDARLKAELKSLLEKNGLKLEDLIKGQGDLKARIAELTAAADKLLSEKIARANELAKRSISAEEKEAAEKEQLRRELEVLTGEVTAGFGAFSAASALLGDQKAAAFFSRGGQFFASGMQAFVLTSSFAANPFAAVNSILQTALLGRGLFGKGEVEPTQKILEELQKVKGMIAELGQHLDARLNAIDSRLQAYMRESLQRMDKDSFFAEKNDADIRYLKNALAQVHRETYGTYLLTAGLASSRLQHNCFTTSAQKVMDADLFRLCRNELALLALAGPPAGSENTLLAAGPTILDPLAEKLNASFPLPYLSGEVKPNPVAWLSATDRMVSLAQLYPQFAHLLQEVEYDPSSYVSYEKIKEAGEYYQSLLQNIALRSPDGAQPKLRRDLIEKLLDQYAVAVRAAVRFGTGVVNRVSLGSLNPKLDLNKQGSEDPSVYSFMNTGIGFCDDKSKFEWHYNNFHNRPLLHFESNDVSGKKWHTENVGQIKWPREFLDQVPGVVKFALSGKGFMQTQARTCIRKAIWIAETPPGDKGSVSTLTLDIDLLVSYLSNGKVRDLTLGTYQTIRTHTGYRFWGGPEASTFQVFWSGYEGGGKYVGEPGSIQKSILNNFKGAFTFKEVDLAEFKKDLAPHLRMAQVEVEQEISQGTSSFDYATVAAREQLAFILAGGLANNSPQTSQLLAAVTNSLNFPNAKNWALAVVEQGATEAQLDHALEEKLEGVRKLLSSVEMAGGLKPKSDLFGPRLEELEQLGRKQE